MSFLNPFLLFGLLGASVPIVIHLIHKRKPRRHPFSAIELVLKSALRVEKRWRLKRILLLLARVLLIAALALAASGPMVGTRDTLAVSRGGAQRIAIVIDSSLSMRARYGTSTAFEEAIKQARKIIDAMGPEDQAMLVAAKAQAKLLTLRPTPSRTELFVALEKLEPSYEYTDLGEAVTAAAKALASLREAKQQDPKTSTDAVQARVVLLSDLAQSSVASAADLRISDDKVAALEVIDVLSGVPPDARRNNALSRMAVVDVPIASPYTIDLRTRIQSFGRDGGGKPDPTPIVLKQNNVKLEASHVDVLPGALAEKVLRHTFQGPGTAEIEVALDADTLVEDNHRYAIVDIQRQVRSLVVNGAPAGVAKEDEVFYLERALKTGASDQPAPRIITYDDFKTTDLSLYDVVILAGVPSVSGKDGQALTRFVERGGGLLVTSTEDMDVEAYNRELGTVLPRALRGLKVVDPEAGGVGSGGIVGLSEPLASHPVIEIFQGESLGGLLSTRTRAYILLQPGTGQPAEILVEHEDGQPAFIEGQFGQGRCIFFTTSIDRDMTDLPIRPAFVPLVRQLTLYLGQALKKPDRQPTLAGAQRDILIPKKAKKLKVIAPDGQETLWPEHELGENPSIRFQATEAPGHYRVEVSYGDAFSPVDDQHFAVNVDTRESNLEALDKDEATLILTGAAAAPGAPKDDTMLERAQALSGLSNPEAVAGLFLILMLIAFALESLLTAQRIGT